MAELLITIVILGVLAAISMQVMDAKRHALLATLRSDIKNITFAQETYYAENYRYASSMPQLEYSPSPDVQVTMVVNRGGYTVRVRHMKLLNYLCSIYFGDVNPVFPPAVEEGAMVCEPRTSRGRGGGQGQGQGG